MYNYCNSKLNDSNKVDYSNKQLLDNLNNCELREVILVQY